MAMIPGNAEELFITLESNNPERSQEMKNLIHENLNSTAKETWLINGLIDYYLDKKSPRCLDIITSIREPHDKHLFDKLSDGLKGGATRMQAVTLLGHIIRKQPSWLHKIAHHNVLKELLKILKNDNDIPIIMNACLVLVTLLPMIPALISSHLTEIFEIFSRLAAWKTKKSTPAVPDIFVLHMQVGVYALFHRLYGMYPCNFLSYLRLHYRSKDQVTIFAEAIRPMMERVRMHPLLVTTSMEAEISNNRWMKMEPHDIVVECARFSLDAIEGTCEDISAISANVMMTSTARPSIFTPQPLADPSSQAALLSTGKDFATGWSTNENASIAIMQIPSDSTLSKDIESQSKLWSPSLVCTLATSPPMPSLTDPMLASVLTCIASKDSESEAASIPDSAEPCFSSVSAILSTTAPSGSPPLTPKGPTKPFTVPASPAALGAAGSGGHQSLPSSPFRKDALPFRFPQTGEDQTHMSSDKKSSSVTLRERAGRMRQHSAASPRTHSQDESGFDDDKYDFVDQEVVDIIREGGAEPVDPVAYRRSDSVIHDLPEGLATTAVELEDTMDSDGNTASMHMFVKYVRSRLRFYSQCGPTPDVAQLLPAPQHQFSLPTNIRRSRSWPELGDNVRLFTSTNFVHVSSVKVKDNVTQKLASTIPASHENIKPSAVEAESMVEGKHVGGNSPLVAEQHKPMSSLSAALQSRAGRVSSDGSNIIVQTSPPTISPSMPNQPREVLPYEHLLADALPISAQPCVYCDGCRAIVMGTLPGYQNPPTAQTVRPSPPELLDRHIQLSKDVHAKAMASPYQSSSSSKFSEEMVLRGQIQLLHTQLQFERHKRETHALRNRRLLGKVKYTRTVEEQLKASRNQSKSYEDELRLLKANYKQLVQKSSDLQQQQQRREDGHLSELRMLRQENEQLKLTNNSLQSYLDEKNKENEDLQENLLKAQRDIQATRQEMLDLERKVAINSELRMQLEQLNKEVLLMSELNLKYREKFDSLQIRDSEAEENTLVKVCKQELEAIKLTLLERNRKVDALQVSTVDLEKRLRQKEMSITQQKNQLEELKKNHQDQIQSVLEKSKAYNSMFTQMAAHNLKLMHLMPTTVRPRTGETRIRQASGSDERRRSLEGSSSRAGASTEPDKGQQRISEPWSGEHHIESYCKNPELLNAQLQQYTSAGSDPPHSPGTIPVLLDQQTMDYLNQRLGIPSSVGSIAASQQPQSESRATSKRLSDPHFRSGDS